jgi:hypothetical protein
MHFLQEFKNAINCVERLPLEIKSFAENVLPSASHGPFPAFNILYFNISPV